jgi:hypothetical protein
MKPEDKAVIQQVLDVLVDCIPSDPQEAEKAIAGLRQLLEKPEPAPVQSAERGEPVAWVYTRNGHEDTFSWKRWDRWGQKGWAETRLYIHPPAQPAAWVGLTDEERRKLFDPLHDAPFEFAKRIEAKLREKNGGAA